MNLYSEHVYREAEGEKAPRMTPERKLLLAVLGLTAGFLSGFLGIGGGLVIVPVLTIAFQYPIKRAVGTSLATIVMVSLVGVLTELVVSGSNIHWVMGLFLTGGSLLGSWGGGRILPRVPDTFLRLFFAVLLVLASHQMVVSAQFRLGTGPIILADGSPGGYLLALAVGAAAGFTSVLFGIGGGIVIVPALSLVFGDVPFHAARATSLVTIIPTSGFGAYQHRGMGTVDASVVMRLIPTGLIGAVLGVFCVNLLPAGPCRLAFAAFLVLAAIRLLTAKRWSGADSTDPTQIESIARVT